MLLNIDKNAKTVKGQSQGFMTGILYMKPNAKTCPNASKECMRHCLNTAGRGIFKSVQDSRKKKTKYFYSDTNAFLLELMGDISTLKRRARKAGLTPVVRLNGTSDIDWEEHRITEEGKYHGFNIFELFSETQFYDYTKDFDKLVKNQVRNYHLTFSHSGTNQEQCTNAVERGFNVAIPFHNPPKGPSYINGDEHDLRFLDVQGGMIVTLKAKGNKQKKSINSFFQ